MLSCEGDSEYIFVFSPTFLWSLLEAQVTAPVAHLSFLYPKGDSFLGLLPTFKFVFTFQVGTPLFQYSDFKAPRPHL